MRSALALLLASAAPSAALLSCSRAGLQRQHRRSAPAIALCAATDGDGSWRIDRARLNDQFSREVMSRRSKFLPFPSARQWARAMHFTEEADWRQWIDDGEKRNPYIPSMPDEVYADAGWAGWDDFLNGPIEELSDILKPGYRRGKWLKGPLSADPPPPDR